ncbi:MAG: cytochrome P450 [Bacteriovoracaceae bacterium]
MSKHPPGPRGFLQIYRLIQGRKKDVLGLTRTLFKTYGDFLYFKIGQSKVAVVNDPEIAQLIMQTNAKSFSKGIGYNRFKFLLGDGLLTSEGSQWRRQRLLCAPAFTRASIEKNFPEILELVEEMKNEWKEKIKQNGPIEIDLASEMNTLALSLISQIMFGSNRKKEAEQIKNSLQKAMKFLDISGKVWVRLLLTNITFNGKPLLVHWEKRFPSKTTRNFMQAVQELNQVVESLIEERQKSETTDQSNDDLLGRLMAATDEEGKMNKTQLKDEVMTILLAGHETTALALAWTWSLLGTHPEAKNKIDAELASVISQGETLQFSQLDQLKYTKKVFEESMRLHPPFWRVSRRSLEEVKLGNYTLPKHTDIVISTYTLHRHEKYWENPDSFNPERMNEEEKKKRHAFTYIPFGAGPRVCLGELFAYTEALTALAMISRDFDFTPLKESIEPELSITMKPKGGYPVRLKLKGNP